MTDEGKKCPRCFISQPLDAPAKPLCGMCVADLKREYHNYNHGKENK